MCKRKIRYNIIILHDANRTKAGREESSEYVNDLISIYTWSSLLRKVVDSLFHDSEGAAFLPELSMVLISDNTNTIYQYTNNERWVRYIDTLQLVTLSIKRFPLQSKYQIVVMHHNEIKCNLEFRIAELGLML